MIDILMSYLSPSGNIQFITLIFVSCIVVFVTLEFMMFLSSIFHKLGGFK